MRKLILGLLAGVAVLVISACTSSSATEERTPDPNATVSAAKAQIAANDVPLKGPDYPSGWAEQPPDTDDTKLGLTGECAVLEEDSLPGELAHSVSSVFKFVLGQEVTTGSSVFGDAASAEAAFNNNAALVDTCATQLAEAYKAMLLASFASSEVPAELITADDVVFSHFEPQITAESVSAFRLTTTLTVLGERINFVDDVIFLRQGKVNGFLTYYCPCEPEGALEAQLGYTLVTKMRLADEGLP
jgi:hypothetical protein